MQGQMGQTRRLGPQQSKPGEVIGRWKGLGRVPVFPATTRRFDFALKHDGKPGVNEGSDMI